MDLIAEIESGADVFINGVPEWAVIQLFETYPQLWTEINERYREFHVKRLNIHFKNTKFWSFMSTKYRESDERWNENERNIFFEWEDVCDEPVFGGKPILETLDIDLLSELI